MFFANHLRAKNEETINVDKKIVKNEPIQNAKIIFAQGVQDNTLTLNASGNTIQSIKIMNPFRNNTLELTQGNTSTMSNIDIEEINSLAINIRDSVNLTFNHKMGVLGSVDLNFFGKRGAIVGGIDMTNPKDEIALSLGGSTTINLGKQGVNTQNQVATIDGMITPSAGSEIIFNTYAKNATFRNGKNHSHGLSFSNGIIQINLETTNSTLKWQTLDGITQPILTNGSSTAINFKAHSTLDTSIVTNRGNTTIEIDNDVNATITGIIQTKNHNHGTPMTKVVFGSESSLVLMGQNNNITQLVLGGGKNILSLTQRGQEEDNIKRQKRVVTIEEIDEGDKSTTLTLISKVSENMADTFIINGISKSNNSSVYNLGVVFAKGVKVGNVLEKNIRVASVKTSTKIIFPTQTQMVDGFNTSILKLTTFEDGDYTHYSIGKISDCEIIKTDQSITHTALLFNYDLYIANFNSLNKHIKTLYENPYNHGIWARIINGAQNNDFGLGSKSNYTTIQAGYDYAFKTRQTSNYLGVALSYTLSIPVVNSQAIDTNSQTRKINSVYSNAIDAMLYNSYISSIGWHNNTVLKFSYLTSAFNINNLNTGENSKNKIANFALTLTDEVGYTFEFGTQKEWKITPKFEIGLGYFNPSHFIQSLQNTNSFLDSISQSLKLIRIKTGGDFEYNLKKILQKKMFNINFYLGMFYEYDYVNGGNILMKTDWGIQNNTLNLANSDSRMILEIGSHVDIKNHTRIYLDFEKSFLGKIRTDYQINLGVRYNFGE